MIESFSIFRRNYGHWDIACRERGRLFRLRGGPGEWRVFDEREENRGQDSKVFKDQAVAMSYICSELMHELLTVEGQTPHVMESWNISETL